MGNCGSSSKRPWQVEVVCGLILCVLVLGSFYFIFKNIKDTGTPAQAPIADWGVPQQQGQPGVIVPGPMGEFATSSSAKPWKDANDKNVIGPSELSIRHLMDIMFENYPAMLGEVVYAHGGKLPIAKTGEVRCVVTIPEKDVYIETENGKIEPLMYREEMETGVFDYLFYLDSELIKSGDFNIKFEPKDILG